MTSTRAPAATAFQPLGAEPGRPRALALDGLRGIAIIAVLLFHLELFAGGLLGVDLFFVLSGYLITSLLLREQAATGRISIVSFWSRRVRRLLPAFAVLLAGVSAAVAVSGDRDLLLTTRSDAPWAAANVLNWHLIADAFGYWDRFGLPRAFEHLWSISVEEQFYAAWPLVLAGVLVLAGTAGRTRSAHPAIALAALGLAALSAAAMILVVDPADPTRAYVGTDTRAFALLIGAAGATAPVQGLLARARGRSREAAVAVTAVAIGALWLLADGTGSTWLFRGGLTLHSALCAVLIVLVAQEPSTVAGRRLLWAPLRWAGRISYGLYLWHWPVITLLSPDRIGISGLAHVALVLGVSVAAAGLSLILVEDPVRFRLASRPATIAVIALILVVVVTVAYWWFSPAPEAPVIDLDGL